MTTRLEQQRTAARRRIASRSPLLAFLRAGSCAALFLMLAASCGADDQRPAEPPSSPPERADETADEVIDYDGGDLEKLVGKRLRATGRLLGSKLRGDLRVDGVDLLLLSIRKDQTTAIRDLDGMNVELVGRVREDKLILPREPERYVIGPDGVERFIRPFPERKVSLFSVDVEQVTPLPAKFQHVGWAEVRHGLRLGLRLATAKATFRHGEMLAFDLVLENTTDKRIHVRFGKPNHWRIDMQDSPQLILRPTQEVIEKLDPLSIFLAPREVQSIERGPVPAFIVEAPSDGDVPPKPRHLRLEPGNYRIRVPHFQIDISQRENASQIIDYETDDVEFEIVPRDET